jgi:aminoglycoside phosphotransferase (APT) family kinase protein
MREPIPAPVVAALRALAEQQPRTVDLTGARPLRLHDAAIVLLPAERIVVKLIPAAVGALDRAARAVRVTGWLSAQGFPTVRPIGDPVAVPGYVATLWHQVPEAPARPRIEASAALGRLLRELHALPLPPFTLPTVDPLARLRQALQLDAARPAPVLDPAETAFLTERIGDLADRYASADFPMSFGLIHNDAHTGNLIPDIGSPYGFLLADWESSCLGQREIDLVLVGAPGDRFGNTEEVRAAFTAGYGYDIATWPGHVLLRDIRDFHSLAAYIRAAPHSPAALGELRSRIRSLRQGDRTVRWTVV